MSVEKKENCFMRAVGTQHVMEKLTNRIVVIQECESSTGKFEGNKSLIVVQKLRT
jgi:hypothetical protein